MEDSQQTNLKRKQERFPCPGCGGDMAFDPQNNCLTCPYCGRSAPIPKTIERIEEHSFDEFLKAGADQLGTVAANAVEVSCTSCGATVTFAPPEVAGECPFCGTTIVAQPKSANPMVAPEAVLPFGIAQAQAVQTVKGWISSRWFAPNALKKLAYQHPISGIYIPFWTYDASTESSYSGERGTYYYTTENYTETDDQGNQVTKTRQIRHTAWSSVSGDVERAFDDILIPATKSVSRQRLTALEPWDLTALNPYDPAFIAGYKAQRYQVELNEGFQEAKGVMAPVIDSDVRHDIGGDEQRVHAVNTAYYDVTFKHVLLPVYLGAYSFNQKIYQVMINARTGEIQGDRPYSVWKILLFILFWLAVIGIIVFVTRKH